jgi:alpha/beta superfamily hydrolase
MRDHDQKEPRDFPLAHRDLRAGIDHLQGEGGEVVVLAHGFACNKLVCYAATSGDERPRRQILTTFGAVKAYRPEIWNMVMASAPRMRGAALVVQGAVDPEIEPRARAEELVAAATGSHIDIELLAGGDHYFNNRHAELAKAITGWLGRTPLGAS